MGHGAIAARAARALRDVPDFPKPCILFKDITPVLADAALFADVILAMARPFEAMDVSHVAGIESRGFILAAPIAQALGAGFVPIRKAGRLPGRSIAMDYELEYGHGRLEMHADVLLPGSRVLLVDDVLATGGTAVAAAALIEAGGGAVVGCTFLLAIEALRGVDRLSGRQVEVLVRA